MAKDSTPSDGFLDKIQRHWLAMLLLILGGAVVLFFLLFIVTSVVDTSSGGLSLSKVSSPGMAADEAYRGAGGIAPYPSGNIAPQQKNREVQRSASLSTQVERGAFDAAQASLTSAVTDVGGFILSSNVARYGDDDARTGTYTIKVPSNKYDDAVTRFKQIGEVQTFSESALDVTGDISDAKIEIAAERARLARYKDLYGSYGTLGDRIQLENYIFDQERRIQYLEQSLTQTGQLVQYATVSVTLSEEQSGWTRIGFVGLSDLARTFVESAKTLLYFISAVLPWLIVAGIVWWVVVIVRRKMA